MESGEQVAIAQFQFLTFDKVEGKQGVRQPHPSPDALSHWREYSECSALSTTATLTPIFSR
eukprot:SAG31_NODE_663_length_13021_cov_9.408296_11_plen_61_part_00